MRLKRIFAALILLPIVLSFQKSEENIRRFNQPELFENVGTIVRHQINFNDTIPGNTLLEFKDNTGLPLMYSREILTGVCIDGKCRLVKINLFWHITGRYMGFELPHKEFLSKTEHKPFTPDEYDRLHELLANSLSPLAQYTLDELVPKKDSIKNDVDAVSTATIAAVLDHIVEGAVYTTYTLWHIVYGTTQEEIENLTNKNLNPQLILRLFESEVLNDKIWALNHISEETEITPEIRGKIFEFIQDEDVYLTERALNALKPELLAEKQIQNQLAEIFGKTGFLQKRLILKRLEQAPVIHFEPAEKLASEMQNLRGALVRTIIQLFEKHDIENKKVINEVTELLQNENRFIASQAVHFLEQLEDPDKKTQRKLSKYKKKYNLN
jgi:hypothetical protein